MPSAVVCLSDPETEGLYSVLSRNGRPSGLPLVDLGSMHSSEGIRGYVRYRLRKRFELRVAKSLLEVVPVESEISPRHDIANSQFPNINYRLYLPVVGRLETPFGSDRLVPVSAEELIGNIAAPRGGSMLNQLIDVHREIIEEYAQ